jgi:hypothetical protein
METHAYLQRESGTFVAYIAGDNVTLDGKNPRCVNVNVAHDYSFEYCVPPLDVLDVSREDRIS